MEELNREGGQRICGRERSCDKSKGISLLFSATCKTDLFITEQAEDAIVELHVSAVVLIHLSQYTHQFCPSLGGMGALALMCWQLVEWTLPRAANSLVLTVSYPGNIMASVSSMTYLWKDRRSFIPVCATFLQYKVLIISKSTN